MDNSGVVWIFSFDNPESDNSVLYIVLKWDSAGSGYYEL